MNVEFIVCRVEAVELHKIVVSPLHYPSPLIPLLNI